MSLANFIDSNKEITQNSIAVDTISGIGNTEIIVQGEGLNGLTRANLHNFNDLSVMTATITEDIEIKGKIINDKIFSKQDVLNIINPIYDIIETIVSLNEGLADEITINRPTLQG